MIYVLDTNIIRTLLNFFPKKGKHYERVWKLIDEMIEEDMLISVDECYNELAKQFKNPDDKESVIISKLLLNPKMRETVHQKNILENRPSADAYIVAKAKVLGGTVVTNERFKPGSAQLPNLCKELEVAVISYDDFMEILDGAI